jgi:hypothetical protein
MRLRAGIRPRERVFAHLSDRYGRPEEFEVSLMLVYVNTLMIQDILRTTMVGVLT